MNKIEAKFRIVTPMFISGADQTKAELRVPSIKGALRFWWRALNYEPDPKKLLDKESKIFGSYNPKIGQSKVKMRLKDVDIKTTKLSGKWGINDWRSYIGYGLSEDQSGKAKKGIYRTHIEPGSVFTIMMESQRGFDTVLDAFKLFSLLGGLGSRSRKGWGSASIISSNNGWRLPKNRSEYISQLSELTLTRDNIPDETPLYSAISTKADICIGPSFGNPMDAFKDIGERYKEYLTGIDPVQRAGFGLPRKGVGTNRRGSPFLIHVNQCGPESFWVCTFLRSQFDKENAEPPSGYGPVEDFMNSIGGEMI